MVVIKNVNIPELCLSFNPNPNPNFSIVDASTEYVKEAKNEKLFSNNCTF